MACLNRHSRKCAVDQDGTVSLNPPTQYATDANLRASRFVQVVRTAARHDQSAMTLTMNAVIAAL